MGAPGPTPATAARGAVVLRQHFTGYNKTPAQVQTCTYLERIVAYAGSNVPIARCQLKCVQEVLGRLFKVIAKEIVFAQVAGIFTGLLWWPYCCAASRVVCPPPSTLKALEGFM